MRIQKEADITIATTPTYLWFCCRLFPNYYYLSDSSDHGIEKIDLGYRGTLGIHLIQNQNPYIYASTFVSLTLQNNIKFIPDYKISYSNYLSKKLFKIFS